MIRYIIRGKTVQGIDIDDCIGKLGNVLDSDLSAISLSTGVIVSALDRLGQKLLADEGFVINGLVGTGMSEQEAREAKRGAASILDRKQLYRKLKRELSEKPAEITRVSVSEPYLEGFMPLGVLGHVTSSNDAFLPFLSAVEGLLAGNINMIKTAAGASDVAIELAGALCEIEPALEPYLYVFPISSKETTRLKTLFSYCDAVAVWGGESAVKGVSEMVPPGVPVIVWGHRISFSYVTKAGKSNETLLGIARDVCVNEQQACSAPQVVYFETDDKNELLAFAADLSDAMKKISPQYPEHEKTDAEQAELTSCTEMAKLKEIMGDCAVFDDSTFRIFADFNASLESSPLYRTILVKPMKRDEIIKTLRPFRSYLQSVGLAAEMGEIAELSMLFYRAGATRITSAGGMANGYTGEPHDGIYALSRYVRRVSLENATLPETIMDLAEMRPVVCEPFPEGTPILKKADFEGERPATGEGYLLLKSGGSSGKSVYAPHTYGDAQTTYVTAGRAMVAAGIKPGDTVMNMFYAGSLYGGFISMYEGLKYIDAVQLPMSSIMDFEFVAQEIIENNVNTLIGMPSYLFNLFDEQKEALKNYGGIEKVLYGGEHLNPKQADWYMSEFGVKSVKSLVYGCNELGSIGYVCEFCKGSEHHLFGSMYMEILKMDSDEPVCRSETGRIVLTPTDKEHVDVNRYEIGDLGRYITEPCACGRKAPKFELLGRFGDTFKFATNYVNYNHIKSVLAESMGYTGNLQLMLVYDEKETMRILVDKNTDVSGFIDALTDGVPEILECSTDHTGTVIVEATDHFVISSAGGKVRNVVDLRK